MTVQEFLAPAAALVVAARAEFADRPVSDTLDEDGHQYVDLVLGGGGLLGFGLVGYTYLLEEVGVRFLRVGGTGAGAVVALGLAALGPPAEARSRRLLAELAAADPWAFVDGPPGTRALVRDWLAGRPPRGPAALNPGRAFRDWLAAVVGRAGVTTARQLRERLHERPPGLRLRTGDRLTAADADARLAVVAHDLTADAAVELPRAAARYWPAPDGVHPADLVRAAAGIPFFFEPVRAGPGQLVDASLTGPFPADLFAAADRPTFGVRLVGGDRPVPHPDPLVRSLTGALRATRDALDAERIARSPGLRDRVGVVDVWKQNWLGLDLTADDRVEQFLGGAEAAVRFLRGFEWPAG